MSDSTLNIDVNLLRLQIKALNEKLSKQAAELEKYKKALEIAKDQLSKIYEYRVYYRIEDASKALKEIEDVLR